MQLTFSLLSSLLFTHNNHKYNVFLINVHSHLSIHCHKEIKASGLAKKANYLTLLRTVYIKT